jgi:hypothetical protein
MVHDPDRPDDADATRPIRPADADATQIHRPADDATQVHRPADDATQIQRPADDATQVHRPAADATRISDPVDETTALPPEQPPPRWAARANVPPAGAVPRRPAPETWEDETPEDPYGGRSWFTPVIVGIVALVLAAGLGTGIWLIYRATRDNTPTADVSPSAEVSSAPASSAPPSSPPPSPSASPSPSPSPEGTPIPTLRGQTERSATDTLAGLGLNVTVQRRSDPTVEPGRVIDTNPPAGTTVAPGSTVILIVASTPSPSPSRSTRPPSPSVAAS